MESGWSQAQSTECRGWGRRAPRSNAFLTVHKIHRTVRARAISLCAETPLFKGRQCSAVEPPGVDSVQIIPKTGESFWALAWKNRVKREKASNWHGKPEGNRGKRGKTGRKQGHCTLDLSSSNKIINMCHPVRLEPAFAAYRSSVQTTRAHTVIAISVLHIWHEPPPPPPRPLPWRYGGGGIRGDVQGGG